MPSRPRAATPALRRLEFGHFSEFDVRNSELRKRILSRDKNTCADCGLNLPRHMEVRHLDDDHTNMDESNLVCVCPFCHCRDHLHTTGFAGAGVLMGSTTLNQAIVNSLVIACWYAVSRIPDETDIRVIPTEETATLQMMRKHAEVILNDLNSRSLQWSGAYGAIVAEPDAFAEALSDLYVASPQEYAKREESTKHLILVPAKEAFDIQCEDWFRYFDERRPIASWSKGLDSWMAMADTNFEDLSQRTRQVARNSTRPGSAPSALGRPMGAPTAAPKPTLDNLDDPLAGEDSASDGSFGSVSKYD